MREIALDTETTGLRPDQGDRIVEIGCVELYHKMPTGRTFQAYLNPEGRAMSEEAMHISGITDDMLSAYPPFSEVCERWLAFIQDDPLVIHNADFDMGFLNMELGRLDMPPLDPARIIDTLAQARQKFPGSPGSLDALCRRFEIDRSQRTKHGALVDAQLLAEVYLHLQGGHQVSLGLMTPQDNRPLQKTQTLCTQSRSASWTHTPTPEEQEAHKNFLDSLDNPLWRKQEVTS